MELGQEIVVDSKTGTWHTVGDNGAEFTKIKSSDIVFNHKQSEELLKNGHINSRGKAYASGKDNLFAPLSSEEMSKYKLLNNVADISSKLDFCNQKLFDIDKAVEASVSTNNNNTQNQVFNIENTFVCNGVTIEQVQSQIEGNFAGMMNRALQKTMTR